MSDTRDVILSGVGEERMDGMKDGAGDVSNVLALSHTSCVSLSLSYDSLVGSGLSGDGSVAAVIGCGSISRAALSDTSVRGSWVLAGSFVADSSGW